MKTVLVLAGGPDAEREVSLKSASAIAAALEASGRYAVEHRVVGAVSVTDLRGLPGDVVWPALHGPYGEGGPMQDVLEADGRPYVGCGPGAARLAMDKMATKQAAAMAGIRTAAACVLNPTDPGLPIALPVVVKPIFEGSTIGLHVCRTDRQWLHAREEARRSGKPYMIERFIEGREVTAGLVDRGSGLEALPLIEIMPAEGLYDYEAKYTREDTRYVLEPGLPGKAGEECRGWAGALARALGVRHLARADFMVDGEGRAWLLEINTMPGFTDHSLVPMAGRHAGLEMPALCAAIVDSAPRTGAGR